MVSAAVSFVVPHACATAGRTWGFPVLDRARLGTPQESFMGVFPLEGREPFREHLSGAEHPCLAPFLCLLFVWVQ